MIWKRQENGRNEQPYLFCPYCPKIPGSRNALLSYNGYIIGGNVKEGLARQDSIFLRDQFDRGAFSLSLLTERRVVLSTQHRIDPGAVLHYQSPDDRCRSAPCWLGLAVC